jgi:hypothetical protein
LPYCGLPITHVLNQELTMSRFTLGRVLPFAALVTVGACGDSGGPSSQGQVSLNAATQVAPASADALALVGTPETFSDGTNSLVVTGVQLVLREIELHKAGITSECAPALDDDCAKLEVGPVLLDLPLGTAGSVRTFNVALEPGSYDRVEFELHKPSPSSDAAFVAAHPDLDGVSVRVTGTYNNQEFTYTGDFNEEQEFDLVPGLTVTETGTADLTLFASLDLWFRDSAGNLVNPISANAGGPNQGLVEQNIKSSLDAFEDENHDGRDDGPGHQ